eukprot:811561-Ditylum_brightwellii.AAC.1
MERNEARRAIVCAISIVLEVEVCCVLASTEDEARRAVVWATSIVLEVEVCCVLTSTEGTMPESKTAGDISTCTVLSLQDSGIVTFISPSDNSFCGEDEVETAI